MTYGRRRAPRHVRAVVDQDPGVPGEQRPIGARRRAEGEDAGLAGRARDELLLPVEHDLDRPADVPGEQRGDDVDRVEVEPPAEVPADRRLDDANAVPGDPERLRQVLLVEERDLGRGPHREAAAGIPLGDGRHRPDAGGGDVVQPIRPLDDHVGLAECPVDVAGVELVGEVDEVPRELRVNPRRVGAERGFRIEDRGQLLVRDVDQPARLLRDLLGLGRHRGHLVADAANQVALQGQVVLRVAERMLLDVAARDDAQHPGERLGPGRVDPRDARVRHPRPEDLPPHHPGNLEIGEVLDRSGHLLDGVELGDPRADDPERPGPPVVSRGLHGRAADRARCARALGLAHAGVLPAARMRSAATSTARMILT